MVKQARRWTDRSAQLEPRSFLNAVQSGYVHANLGDLITPSVKQRTLEEAKRSGCSEAWVLTDRGNQAAMALYKSAGGIEDMPDSTMFTFEL